MNSTWTLAAAVAALAAGLGASVYTIDAREVAVVTQFGAPIRTLLEPGLYLRAPWPLHEVVRFDRRAHLLQAKPAEVLTKDKKNLVVESFVVWRVDDPQLFLESVGTQEAAEVQLGDLVTSQIAASLGQQEFSDMLSVDPEGAGALLPSTLQDTVGTVAAGRLGVEVLTIELRHLGFPLQNEQSIYERMRAERSRIANAYRSEGEEKAAAIRADADRQATEILATAERDAAGIRAEAEGRAAALYAAAYKRDPGFYRFIRQLEAADAVLDEDSVLVLDADDPLFRTLTQGAP